MRRGFLAAAVLAAAGLSSCGFGSDETTTSTLPPLESTSFRTIPTTSTTLSEVTSDATGGGTTNASGEQLYTVQAGDYPLKVVQQYGCDSWEQIANYNDIDPSSFPYPGDQIRIPAVCGSTETSTETTAASTGTTAAGGSGSGETTTTAAAAGGEATYTVQAGDTMYGIAAKFDVSAEELVAANGWSDGVQHPLYPGDTIKIPG